MNDDDIVHRMPTRTTSRPLNRRTFILGGSAAVAGLAARRTPSAPITSPVFGQTPFTLGVASGDPLPDGVVLWTRLAPYPFEVQGGMAPDAVEVRWQVATDDRMTRIARQGTAVAEADWAHSVHVEVQGLEPDRPYWYRLTAGSEESPVGRTKTAPAPGTMPDRFTFAFASCQRWDHGLYTAYRDLARRDVDLVVHLGDYIYESGIHPGTQLRPGDYPGHILTRCSTLADYRNRYALYKLDPHLQEAHRLARWLVTWDDHEVENNSYGEMPRDVPVDHLLLELRTAAYQAWYEHQPVRKAARPVGPDLRLYRHRAFGDLVEFNVLDTRQYRSPQGTSCNAGQRSDGDGFCPASLDPDRTLLGDRQKSWLADRLDRASARWNVLAQQVPFARIDHEADPVRRSFGGKQMDAWDGYAFEREQVSAAVASAARARTFAPIVITGDVHANHVWDLKTDWDDETGASVYGTEFVGTSISSAGDEARADGGGYTTECGNRNGNSHNHLYDNHRGYVLCHLTADRWEPVYRVMPNVVDEHAEASTLASFVVEHGNPGAQVVTGCEVPAPDGG